MRRTAILIDDRDRRLGTCVVPETITVIRHAEGIFVRTETGIRLSGGGIGVVFRETEAVERTNLKPI